MPEEKRAHKKINKTQLINDRASLDNAVHKISQLEEAVVQQKKINEILQDMISHYRTISEMQHDAIFIIDKEGFVQYVNCAAASLLKSKAGNIIGRPLRTLFPSDTFAIQKKNLDRVFHEKSPLYTEDKIVFPGAEIWLDTHLIPIKDRDGTVSSVLGIARDTTKRRNPDPGIPYSRGLQTDSSLKHDTDILTKREKEVLKLIASGMTNKRIAEDLCISVKTVDTHRMKVMKKINAHNTASLVRFAINTGLI